MKIVVFAKALAVLTVIAMVANFLTPSSGFAGLAINLIKYEGLALAGAIVAAFAYPHVRGVEAGEKVLVKISDPMTNRMSFQIATALENGKLNQKIRISLNGGEAVAVVESYPGILTPAWVTVGPEGALKVI